MLYKFKSKVTGDIIMLEPNGRRILEIIGKDIQPESSRQGIIHPAQMVAAIAALEAAIAKQEAEQKALTKAAIERDDDAPQSELISLRQRAQPFIEMLHRCEKAGTEIVWGV